MQLVNFAIDLGFFFFCLLTSTFDRDQIIVQVKEIDNKEDFFPWMFDLIWNLEVLRMNSTRYKNYI